MIRTIVDIVTGEITTQPLTEEEISAASLVAANEARKSRVSMIESRLAQIDLDAIRPMRAVNAGTATAFDTDKLAALEAEAASLRVERAGLA